MAISLMLSVRSDKLEDDCYEIEIKCILLLSVVTTIMTIDEANMGFAVVTAATGHVHCDKPGFPSRHRIGYKDWSQCSSSSLSKWTQFKLLCRMDCLFWRYYTLR